MNASLFGIFTPYDIFLNDMYKYHAWNVYLMTLETLAYPFRAFCFIVAISFFFLFFLTLAFPCPRLAVFLAWTAR